MITTFKTKSTTNIYIALAKYGNLRHPDYDEARLLKTLRAGFNKFAEDALALLKQTPNNRGLQKIVSFFDYHYKNSNLIIEVLEQA